MLPVAPVQPFHLGPVWETDAEGNWALPAKTLGWQIIGWIAENLLLDGEPVALTDEQMRFILWMYAVDHRGRFVFRDIVLQRMKGWGKDPLAAIIAAVEFVGPCRFEQWAQQFHVDEGEAYAVGDPIAIDNGNAWVQIFGVSEEQTKNTMIVLMSIFTPACIEEHGIDIGKEKIYAYHGARRIEIVSSSSRAAEGNRPTFVIRNETHHWLATNGGHDVQSVIRRNLAKIKGGQARALSITNAYSPGEDSVGERQRLAYEMRLEKQWWGTIDTMYDSLEAPPGSTLFPGFTAWDENGNEVTALGPDGRTPVPPSEEVTRHHIARILTAVRGDATWLDVERLVGEILNPEADTDLEDAKRFYFNSVSLGDDAAFDPEDIRATVSRQVHDARRNGVGDPLRVGWSVVDRRDEIVMFGDGSKSDDATGLVGCRLSDGYTFTVGVWQKPAGELGLGWRAPRDQIDSRVREAFDRFNLVAFWFDPSHTKDDDKEAGGYWDSMIDRWHQDYGERLQYWATNTGDRRSAIAWDMTSPTRQVDFVKAVRQFTDDLVSRLLVHDGHPSLMDHLRNARARMTLHGWSIGKSSRGSKKKIDLAVCAVGARMLRRVVLNKGLETKDKPAKVWWAPVD